MTQQPLLAALSGHQKGEVRTLIEAQTSRYGFNDPQIANH
jgi:hypothetical protein